MSKKLTVNGSPYLGVFATNTEDLAIIPPDVSHRMFQEMCEALNVKGVKTFICECSVLGALIRGNSHGFVVPSYTLDAEIAKIEKHAQVLKLPGKMDAAGNLILANDGVAIVHPDIGKSAITVIKDALNVEVYKGMIGGLKTVGMAAVATNKGVLVHPKATTSELRFLEDAFGLPVDVGTVNFGSGLIGAALLANSKGYVVGAETTGPELGRIQYQSRAEAYRQQLAMIELSVGECESAINALEQLEKVKAEKTTLVPIGAGAYVHATISQVDKILMNLGAGVSAEKDSSAARETLTKRKDDLTKMYERLSEDLRGMHNEMQKLQLKIAQYR